PGQNPHPLLMKRIPLWAIPMLLGAYAVLAADELPLEVRIRDGGAVRRFEVSAAKQGERESAVILFEQGVPGTEYTRRILTRRVHVEIAPGDAVSLARKYGAETGKELSYA